MAPKDNTRKAGLKKVKEFCMRRAKKTHKVKNAKLVDWYVNRVCVNYFKFKDGRWVPRCDEVAKERVNFYTKTKRGKKTLSNATRTRKYKKFEKDCLNQYKNYKPM
jgi:hypothetical protein